MPKPSYCWDSCVIIALLTGEKRAQDEVDGLREVADLVDRHEAVLITSSQVLSEVLADPQHPTVRRRLEALFRRPSCVMYDLTQPVLTKAGEIRAAARASGRRNMTAADSHFVATALLYGASALHTFDDKLLRWSGSALVDGLIICRPRAEQTLLDI